MNDRDGSSAVSRAAESLMPSPAGYRATRQPELLENARQGRIALGGVVDVRDEDPRIARRELVRQERELCPPNLDLRVGSRLRLPARAARERRVRPESRVTRFSHREPGHDRRAD